VAKKTVDFDTDVAGFTRNKRQMAALKALDSGKVKYLLYGGALGGGKSYLLRWYGVRRLMTLYQKFGLKHITGMLACEDYPSLKDRQLQKILFEFPPWLGTYHGDHKVYGRCFILKPRWGSGVLCFRNLDDPSKYASSEWALILVDELTKNTYEIFTFLRTRLRWPGIPDIETQFVGGTNPGGPGHGWCKQMWMDREFPEEFVKPIDYRDSFAYVPSKADDNPFLDESYWATLQTLPPELRKAFRDGSWDIFLGQALPMLSRDIHGIDPMPVPEHAPLMMTYDWGWGRPFSLGWWWIDQDGRLIRFHEWYGYTGTANQGLRMADGEVAKGIKKIEKELDLGIWGGKRHIMRIAGPDCFNKKPDYRGGGQGPSTAEEFGRQQIYLTPGDPSRDLKIRQVRQRLQVPEGYPSDPKAPAPMMLIYKTCTNFFRTMTTLPMDETHVEDVDTKAEDHIYDEVGLACMARPMPMVGPKKNKPWHERRIEELQRPPEITDELAMAAMDAQAIREMGYDPDEVPEDAILIDNSGEMVPTIGSE
jgi:hypothetical protein